MGRPALLGAIAGLAVLALVAGLSATRPDDLDRAGLERGGCAELEPQQPADALQARAVAQLQGWLDWLDEGGARGWIGEVGWPGDDPRWNELASVWFSHVDRAPVWVTAWATGEWWGPEPLAVYRVDGDALGRPAPQAAVLEASCRGPEPDRGVNVNGGEFGIGPNLGTGQGGPFSAEQPGTFGVDYHYESAASLAYLASRGVEVVRLPFRWERLQPELGAPLDADELERLRAVLDRAHQAGLAVIPTPMNYGARWHDDGGGAGVRHAIGGEEVPVAAFVDLWARMVGALDDHPGVLAWGLMNEPVDVPGGGEAWERATQAAVDAIRAEGSRRTIAVPGHRWSGVRWFAEEHPDGPWIDDPLDDVVYEAHQYFDVDGDGEYRAYAVELHAAEQDASAGTG